jgi:hypothetical protein
MTDNIETLADLAEQTPLSTKDVTLGTGHYATDVRIGDTTFSMGLFTEKERVARGLTRFEYHTGPYVVKVYRDTSKLDGTEYRIDAVEREQ